MKYLIVILIFLPAFLNGQTFATKDTSYRVSSNGKFFNVREVEYSDGTGSTVRTLIGDTLTIFSAYLQDFQVQTAQMAADARKASRFGKDITTLLNQSGEAFAITGRDVLDTITARQAGPLLLSGWIIKDTSGTKDILFLVNANGQLRYTVAGFQTRNADLFGGVLRLNNYLSSGQDVDLFKAVSGNWFTIDDKLKMRFPGQNDAANRVTAKPPTPEKSGILLEYSRDSAGKIQIFAGDNVTLKKSGAKYVLKVGDKTYELSEKKK